MYKYRWLGILILAVSLVYTTNACDKPSGSKSVESKMYVTDTPKVESNRSDGDKNINNTSTAQSTTLLNRDQKAPVINNSGDYKGNSAKEIIMGSNNKQISEEDFEIVFKSIRINKNTKVEDITNKLGFPDGYEASNQGYISGNAKFRRWNLCYPSYSKPEIRIIILSERKYVGGEVKDGNSYIVGISLDSCETQKGLNTGSKLEKVLQLYGKPESMENNVLRYSKGNLHLDITLNDAKEKVHSIFIDYNMEKSIKDQGSSNN